MNIFAMVMILILCEGNIADHHRVIFFTWSSFSPNQTFRLQWNDLICSRFVQIQNYKRT